MSLLLQALKRAEEAKRQRATGLPAEPDSSAEIPTIPELEFLPLPEQAELALEPARIEPVLSPLELAPAAPEIEMNVTPAEKPELAFDIQPVPAPQPVIAAPEPVAMPEPVAAPVAPPQVVVAPQPAAPALTLTPAPAPAASDAARQLLSAPKAGKSRNMLPWLVLGGCVLLAGLGAWFWWQFQQLIVPAAPLAATPAGIEASAPAEAPASVPEALSPASAPVAASVSAAVKPARKLASAVPVVVPQPASRDVARYIEPQAKTGQPLQIERRVQEGGVPPTLEAAWQAYNKGDLATADAQYRRMLTTDPRNRDAQLGLAAIAVRRGQKQDAARWYQSLLALNPKDTEARNGLAALDADTLPEQTEARLLQQADQAGSARMLGQYYAANKRWNEAQQQYFMAYSQAPDNADLAFNLAVSLDHINQSKLAGDYYRKALALGNGSFDRAAVEKRLAEIKAAQK